MGEILFLKKKKRRRHKRNGRLSGNWVKGKGRGCVDTNITGDQVEIE